MTTSNLMESEISKAAQRAAQMTRSTLAALGQHPGPPLGPTRRNVSKAPTAEGNLDGEPMEELIVDAASRLQGPLMSSDDDDEQSWEPPFHHFI